MHLCPYEYERELLAAIFVWSAFDPACLATNRVLRKDFVEFPLNYRTKFVAVPILLARLRSSPGELSERHSADKAAYKRYKQHKSNRVCKESRSQEECAGDQQAGSRKYVFNRHLATLEAPLQLP
jgi:hypothetical protein